MSTLPPDLTHAPLFGVKVLVTRPAHQADNLIKLIEQAGGKALNIPVIEISDIEDPQPIAQRLQNLDTYDILVFISPNAVAKGLELYGSRQLPEHSSIAAIGGSTAKQIEELTGRKVDIVPEGRACSENLLVHPALHKESVKDRKIMIFRGQGGKELLFDTLKERGAKVEYAEVYRRTQPDMCNTDKKALWLQFTPDIILFSSAEGLKNFYSIMSPNFNQPLLHTDLLVINDKMALLARELGFLNKIVVAENADDASVFEALLEYFS